MTSVRTKGSLAQALACSASGVISMVLAGAAHAASPLPLLPMPQKVEQQAGSLRLLGPVAPQISGCEGKMVSGAVSRFQHDLETLTGSNSGASVPLAVRCLTHDAGTLTLEAREGYRLDVSTSAVAIEADGETGVLRALATLRQLVGRDQQGALLAAVHISDYPRFAWRGLMIDTARHFISVPTLKRQLDAMELAKLNVLHLHLSDNEGFRVESRIFPRLTTVASQGEYYSQEEVRELVQYAAARGIRIVPEFDIPGHSKALLTAYPELGVAPIDPNDPLARPKSALNPASEGTYRFLKKFLAEMAGLFPDRQFHVGGDEVSDVAWKDSTQVAEFAKKHDLKSKLQIEAWFHARIREILASHGKTTIGWDEMADEPLPPDVIVQAWRSSNPISTATAKGHRVIVSAGFYINALMPADYHYGIDPLDPMAYSTMSADMLAKVRRNPVTAAQVSDGLVARPVPPLTSEQEKLVLGGEGALWGEIVNDAMVDGRLWPRALTLGERFWSDAALRDADDMYARLLPAMEQVRSLGLQDERIRKGMTARLAPEAPDVVDRLVGLVAPTRQGANHPEAMMGTKAPELVELTDAASTDGSPARSFRVNVTAYLAGDVSRSIRLRTELAIWRDNLGAYEKVAAGRPLLEKAVPTARDLADLGSLGLTVLDALEQRKPLAPSQSEAGHALLTKLKNYAASSLNFEAIATMKQPPAALIILTAADVGRLMDEVDKQAGH